MIENVVILSVSEPAELFPPQDNKRRMLEMIKLKLITTDYYYSRPACFMAGDRRDFR